MIAYRQGLTPHLIGQFSRFARWTQVGAALELKLTPDSVYRGLEGGLTTAGDARPPDPAQRPPPARRRGRGDADLGRPPRPGDLLRLDHAGRVRHRRRPRSGPEALARPRRRRVAPSRVSDRLLLVEDEGAIPFTRFRMVGSRDYRRPPETCVDVDGDGVTLSLDLGRSDLLVDAELARFADEIPAPRRTAARPAGATSPRRWFEVSPKSLARAAGNGMTIAQMARWFEQRTGEAVPAAVRLLLHAADPQVDPFPTARPVVMTTPTPELLDGLLQHPATGAYLDDRLGPTTVIIPDDAVADLRAALATLGLTLDLPDTPPQAPESTPPSKASPRPKRL